MPSLAEVARSSEHAAAQARRALEDAALAAADTGSSQREIGAALDRSQPEVARLVDRARRRRSRTWLTAAEYAAGIATELERADPDFALRLLRSMLDTMRALQPDERADFLAERPFTGSPQWDALLRGAVAWTCRELGIDLPRWGRPRPLSTWWFVRPEPALVGRLLRETPAELALVGVWVDAASLRGV